MSPAAGGVSDVLVLLEAGADEVGAEEDCGAAVAGVFWPWAAGMAPRIAAATATPAAHVATAWWRPMRVRAKSPAAAGPARRRPGGAKIAKSGRLPIDLFVRLTFICHGASGGRNPRLLRLAHLAQQSPCPCPGTHFAIYVAGH